MQWLEEIMSWLIERTDRGRGFLTADVQATGGSTYTEDVRKARRYPTRESASRDCCENERPVSLEALLS